MYNFGHLEGLGGRREEGGGRREGRSRDHKGEEAEVMTRLHRRLYGREILFCVLTQLPQLQILVSVLTQLPLIEPISFSVRIRLTKKFVSFGVPI